MYETRIKLEEAITALLPAASVRAMLFRIIHPLTLTPPHLSPLCLSNSNCLPSVFEVTQACCQPVLQSITEQRGVQFALSSAAQVFGHCTHA